MKTIKKLLITVAVLLCCVTANAYDFVVDGIYYNITSITDLTVEVTYGDNEYSDKVIIPETVVYKSKVLKVTSISRDAFNGCKNLTSVVIGNNVTSIIDETFSQCSNLTSVVIGNGVTSIGDNAFDTCRSLKELCIEDGTEKLSLGCKNYNYGNYNDTFGLFYDCPLETLYLGRNLYYSSNLSPFKQNETLTSVTIGNSVTNIRGHAFYECSGLTSIEIPNSVTSIGDEAFYKCYRLTSIEIPNGVTSIGDYAFYECYNLTSVTIPNSVTSIGDYAFYECYNLTSVTIPNSVTSIGDSAFDSCSGLTSVTIPNSVTSIGNGAFSNCSGLTSVTIGNSVTTIGNRAFSNCSGLTSVTIPNSVTSIGYNAFSDCPGLKKIEFKCAKIGTWFNSLSIEEVEIDYRVTSIAGGAFKDCSSLTNIHLLGETPPSVESNTFAESQYATLTIYVPQGSLSTYQSSDVWKNFWDIREESTTETPEEEVKKCATPVITYNNSGLDITSKTDDAKIHTNITCNDVGSYNGSRIDLSETYSITTYATKSGYLNSETVTATLCWIAVSGDSEDNSIIKVEAMPVLITCNNGTINICGGKEGAEVVVYTTSGVAVGNATITNGNATISTGLAKGEIAVINIAGKCIKIVMQ